MGRFFIRTDTGQVATQHQLIDAGTATPDEDPPRPWHLIQAPIDANTMWYAVLRKQLRGVFIGTMTFRHGDHHASLLADGWEEIPVEQIHP
ncbi:MAG TPA: hypothetical protein VD931_05185 [Baekduia sp.]|nr:hypothetical protein [Baekduia sp.]